MKRISGPIGWQIGPRLRRRVAIVATMAVVAGLAQLVMPGVLVVFLVALIAGITEILNDAVDRKHTND